MTVRKIFHLARADRAQRSGGGHILGQDDLWDADGRKLSLDEAAAVLPTQEMARMVECTICTHSRNWRPYR